MLALLYITLFAGLLPVSALLLLKRNAKETAPVQPFVYLTAVGSLYEIIFTLILKKDVTLWFTAYDILAFLFIFHYFFKLNFPKYRMIFLVFIMLFALLVIPQLFDITKSVHHFLNLQAVFSGTTTAFILVMTVLWFKDVFKKTEIPNLWKIPDFYFITALFIYYSGTFFLFLLSDVILKIGSETFMNYWLLNIVAALILRILLTVGIWKTTRN